MTPVSHSIRSLCGPLPQPISQPISASGRRLSPSKFTVCTSETLAFPFASDDLGVTRERRLGIEISSRQEILCKGIEMLKASFLAISYWFEDANAKIILEALATWPRRFLVDWYWCEGMVSFFSSMMSSSLDFERRGIHAFTD
ncbi:hypothetical protein OPV22_032641 [Ensete ventricosum]|uniref:Uncharacterized protein n=1 Tax=Ensete ventricosum TaxID=4639 RepID=A0AAV8P1G5_ENSVE|nr:hypothetical protein OPV22_032641 [Ensete ventricosum]